MNLKVGDELYFEADRYQSHRKSCMVTVVSVGRKWAGISNNLRIDKTTLCADGGGYMSPGRCYVDKDARLAEIEVLNAWQSMRRAFPVTPNKPDLTVEQLAQAREILGF